MRERIIYKKNSETPRQHLRRGVHTKHSLSFQISQCRTVLFLIALIAVMAELIHAECLVCTPFFAFQLTMF
uniref:Uncharacterized protein n=1 Tax=Rhipicephalus microplus TaxID=6941 RepID=A0A6G5AEZ6_RHIMP